MTVVEGRRCRGEKMSPRHSTDGYRLTRTEGVGFPEAGHRVGIHVPPVPQRVGAVRSLHLKSKPAVQMDGWRIVHKDGKLQSSHT